MTALLNISIPPFVDGQRIEDWQLLFIAATSALERKRESSNTDTYYHLSSAATNTSNPLFC